MSPFDALAVLLTIAAIFAYANYRWIRQPASIALMAMSLVLSLIMIGLDRGGVLHLHPLVGQLFQRVALDQALLHGMLGVLLFAGALHIRLDALRQERLTVAALALAATLLSTFLVGAMAHWLLSAVGVPLSFGYCLVFGALISPTDPIAVMGILAHARVPKSLEVQISGESLFNDGVGVVVFMTLLNVVSSGNVTAGEVALLFLREAVGGIVFGAVTGYVTFRLLKSIDHYQTELLLTLALVLGGYAVAEHLHVSAPLSSVAAGLVIGNQGRSLAMSDVTRDHLDKFWSLMDEILNAILFVLVGLEVLQLSLDRHAALAGVLLIPAVLFARLLSVWLPLLALRRVVPQPRGTLLILTWGGLRGGISVALAMSLAPGAEHDLIVTLTYIVVVFSVLGQGLSLGALVRRLSVGAH